jgi:cellulose biosynthesis protein BcsQ
MCIIALPGEKGGIGKSTTTISLDVVSVEMGRRVLLLYTRPQEPCSRSVGGVVSDPARFLYVALSGHTPLTELPLHSSTMEASHGWIGHS